MKQLKKISILLAVLTITFFGGLNKVKAEIKCYYELPFIGVKGDRYYKFEGYECSKSDNDSQDCKMEAQISNYMFEMSGLDDETNGLFNWSAVGYGYDSINVLFHNYVYGLGNYQHSNPIFLYGANEDGLSCTFSSNEYYDYDLSFHYSYSCKKNDPNTAAIDTKLASEEPMYLKSTDKFCPKYLIIRKPNHDSIDFYKKSLLAYYLNNCSKMSSESGVNILCTKGYFEDYTNYSPGSLGLLNNLGYDMFRAYQTSDDDSIYTNYLKNFYNQNTTNVGSNQFRLKNSTISLLSSEDKIVLPLYAVEDTVKLPL